MESSYSAASAYGMIKTSFLARAASMLKLGIQQVVKVMICDWLVSGLD